MKTQLLLSGLAVVSIGTCLLLAPPAPTPVEMRLVVTAPTGISLSIEQALKTAFVDCAEATATCFPIAEKFGCVAWLTCRHVVENNPEIVRLPNGDLMPVLLSVKHPSRDIGILWTAANPALPVSPLPLANYFPAAGTDALLAGYPANKGLWLSRGLIGAQSAPGDLWTSVPIYYGCSGGPVIVDGVAVGVAEGVYVDQFHQQIVSTISCIVPVVQVRDWIDESLARDPRLK